MKDVILLWTLQTPDTILITWWNQKVSHWVTHCKSCKVSFQVLESNWDANFKLKDSQCEIKIKDQIVNPSNRSMYTLREIFPLSLESLMRKPRAFWNPQVLLNLCSIFSTNLYQWQPITLVNFHSVYTSITVITLSFKELWFCIRLLVFALEKVLDWFHLILIAHHVALYNKNFAFFWLCRVWVW